VDDGIESFSPEDIMKERLIGKITSYQSAIEHCPWMAIGKIVINNNFILFFAQCFNDMTSDIPGPTRNKDFHYAVSINSENTCKKCRSCESR
jgi:hypothetical protein